MEPIVLKLRNQFYDVIHVLIKITDFTLSKHLIFINQAIIILYKPFLIWGGIQKICTIYLSLYEKQ